MGPLKKHIIFYILFFISIIFILFGLNDYAEFPRGNTDGVFSVIAALFIFVSETLDKIIFLFYQPIVLFVKAIIGVLVPEVHTYDLITMNMSFARIFSTFFIVLWTLFWAFITFFILNIKNLLNNSEEQKIWAKKFLKYFLFAFVVLNLGIFMIFTNLFNTSLDYLYRTCEEPECYENYLLTKYSNCEKDIVLFVYPFKINSKVDSCTLNGLIENNILKEAWPSRFSELNSAFSSTLPNATDEQKYNYCETFTNSRSKLFCIAANPATLSKNTVTFNRCRNHFSKNNLFSSATEVDNLRLCYNELVDFDIYYFKYDEIMDSSLGEIQISDSLYQVENYSRLYKNRRSSNSIINNLTNEQKKELFYKAVIEFTYFSKATKTSGGYFKYPPHVEIIITQSSVNGPLFAEFEEIKKNALNNTPSGVSSLMGIKSSISELKKIGDYDIFFETIEYSKNSKKVTNVHFILNETYIKVNMPRIARMSDEEENEEENRITNLIIQNYLNESQIIDLN